jgi:hypothetical protein
VWKSFENSLTTLALYEKRRVKVFVYGSTKQSAASVTNIPLLACVNQINI